MLSKDAYNIVSIVCHNIGNIDIIEDPLMDKL